MPTRVRPQVLKFFDPRGSYFQLGMCAFWDGAGEREAGLASFGMPPSILQNIR